MRHPQRGISGAERQINGDPPVTTSGPGSTRIGGGDVCRGPVDPTRKVGVTGQSILAGDGVDLTPEEAYLYDIENIDLTTETASQEVKQRPRRKSDGGPNLGTPTYPRGLGRRKSTGGGGGTNTVRSNSRRTKRRREEPGGSAGVQLARRPAEVRVKRRSVTFKLPSDGEDQGIPRALLATATTQIDDTAQPDSNTSTAGGVQALLNLEGGPLKPALKTRTGVRIGPRRKKTREHKQPRRPEWATIQLLLTDMLARASSSRRTQ